VASPATFDFTCQAKSLAANATGDHSPRGLSTGGNAVPILRSHGFRVACLERLQRAPTTYVYAVSDSTAVKVGKSLGHPSVRLAELQVGNPRPLVLLAWTQHLTERQAHRLLWRHHLRGEWFKPHPALLGALRLWDWLDEAALAATARGADSGAETAFPVTHGGRGPDKVFARPVGISYNGVSR
jgi:hypothetical protein